MSENEKRELAERVTKQLIDEGKIVEAGFVMFRDQCMHPHAPPHQVTEMRFAFMAGAQHLFGSVMSMLDPGTEATEKDLSRMDQICKELDRISLEMKTRSQPRG